MSGAEFWPDLDDNDPVPMQVPAGERPTLGEIRRDAKQERRWRAHVWTFVEIKAKAEMRQTYERAMLFGLTQPQIIGLLSDAAVRVGMAVFDEFEKLNQDKRGKGGKKHGEKVKTNTEAKHDVRWLKHLQALLSKNRTLTDCEIAQRIVKKDRKTTASEMRTVYRYVQSRRPTLQCLAEK